MSPVRIGRVCTGLGLATVLLAPFASGAVSLIVWVPLAWLWIGLGASVTLISRRPSEPASPDRVNPMPRAMVALHLLFALQLVPLPSGVLRVISPGSFAAHFIPPADSRTWASLTASPTGTLQAWLFIAGLQALALAIFGGVLSDRAQTMKVLFLGMAGVGAIMALEGLVQSKSAHPYWLYGVFRVPGAGDHEAGIFGPYYNRDHYSNLIAIAASVAAGVLGAAIRSGAFRGLSNFARSPEFGRNVGLLVALLLMLVASAASGSRGGLIALGVGLLAGLGPGLLRRPRLALASVGLFVVALFGTGVPAAFVRLGDVDFEASRLLVWRDLLRLADFFPVFGCGIGAFAPAYWPYQRVVRFEYWSHVHNEYIQWILEGGVLGMVLAVSFLRLAWIAAPRVLRDIETRPALAGLAAALTHALVDSGFRIPANAAWAGLLLVCLVLAPTAAGAGLRRSVP